MHLRQTSEIFDIYEFVRRIRLGKSSRQYAYHVQYNIINYLQT